MNQPTIPEIHETLKRLLRRRRITYRQLGSRIGMSESGVKKLLGGEDLSMVRLLEICEVLDLEVDELLRVAREGPAEARELDEATKRRLAKHPRDLWFLWALMERGGDVEALRRAIGMDARSARRILARLDAGGFVRIGQDGSLGRLSEDRALRLPRELGEPIMAPIHDAVVEAARRQKREGDRAELSGLAMARLPLRAESLLELHRALSEVLAQFEARSRRERAMGRADELIHAAALCVTSPFEITGMLDERMS